MEGVFRAAFLPSESVSLTVLGPGMCRRRVEDNEIFPKFLWLKEFRERYWAEQMYAAQYGESGHDICVFWMIDLGCGSSAKNGISLFPESHVISWL